MRHAVLVLMERTSPAERRASLKVAWQRERALEPEVPGREARGRDDLVPFKRGDLHWPSGTGQVFEPFEAVFFEAAEPVADTTARGSDLARYRRDSFPGGGEENCASAPVKTGLAALPANDLAEIALLSPGKADVHAILIGKNSLDLYQNL